MQTLRFDFTDAAPRATPATGPAYATDRAYVLNVLARRCGSLPLAGREVIFDDAFLAYAMLVEEHHIGRAGAAELRPERARAFLVRVALQKARALGAFDASINLATAGAALPEGAPDILAFDEVRQVRRWWVRCLNGAGR